VAKLAIEIEENFQFQQVRFNAPGTSPSPGVNSYREVFPGHALWMLHSKVVSERYGDIPDFMGVNGLHETVWKTTVIEQNYNISSPRIVFKNVCMKRAENRIILFTDADSSQNTSSVKNLIDLNQLSDDENKGFKYTAFHMNTIPKESAESQTLLKQVNYK
jgi:hypothetical protein